MRECPEGYLAERVLTGVSSLYDLTDYERVNGRTIAASLLFIPEMKELLRAV
jgi:hypothetical protein